MIFYLGLNKECYNIKGGYGLMRFDNLNVKTDLKVKKIKRIAWAIY